MKKGLLKGQIFEHYTKKELLEKEEDTRLNLLEKPNQKKLLRDLAVILYHRGDYKGAIKIFTKTLNKGKTVGEDYAFLGLLYYENEDFTSAIENFEKSLDMEPQSAFVHFLLGNAYSRAGDIINAITSYDFAIFLDLDIYKSHLDFGEKYENMGFLERALKEYKIAYEIDPRDTELKKRIKKLKTKLNKK